jgi:hypothetical protein
LLALALDGPFQFHSQVLVIPTEMIVGQPPVEMLRKLWDKLCSSPSATGKLGDSLTNGQVGALDEGSIDAAAQSDSLEAGGIFGW